jgi:hypothetical protein
VLDACAWLHFHQVHGIFLVCGIYGKAGTGGVGEGGKSPEFETALLVFRKIVQVHRNTHNFPSFSNFHLLT